MKAEGDIKLNFVALENSSFNFKIYRKEYNQKEPKIESVFVFRLKSVEDNKYIKYSVSFDNREDFDEYNCESWENNQLTKRFLFYALKEKLNLNNSTELEYKINERGFTNTIDFIIHKTNLGNQVITVTPYLLKIKREFGFLIDFKFRQKENTQFNKEVQKLSLSLDGNYKSNRNYYSDKFKIINRFIDKMLSALVPLKVGDTELWPNLKMTDLPSNKLDNKKYIFDNNRTALSQFQGIKSHGPFEQITDEVNYLFIFEERFKSFGNDVFLSLSGKTNPGTFPGMNEMFGLPINKENVSKISIQQLDIQNLEKAIKEVLEFRKKNEKCKIIVILLEESSIDDNDEIDSPYYYLKFNLLKENIPVQVLSYEKVGTTDNLKWSTSNIGLQIFSKLGGIPWLVAPSNSNCLILGIGSSHKIDDETRTVQKYLAYSVCLDSSGLYKKLSILSESETKETYLEDLKNNLINLLKEDEFSNYKKVVLHIPFKVKKDEISSIEEALNEFQNIEFKVVKINLNNKFFGFSDHNTHVPYESSYIKLSKTEYLVWFEGLQYGKEIVYQRTASPVHIQFINFESSSNEEDYSYLQDILNLSGANWRGFNAKSIPISIYYSKLIAEYTKVFENFDDFNREIFSNNKPWFL